MPARTVKRPRRAPRRDRLEEQLRRIQRLVMQGELAATAVHEISNLQTIVLFNAGLLQEEQKGNPAVGHYVDPLMHAAKVIAALCNQLRNLARPTQAQPELLDLNEVARRTHGLLERIIPRELVFEAESEAAVPVIADPGQIEQMMINLVFNARDATADEGGRITVRIGTGRGRRPFLAVEDNGTGMSPKVRSRIFQKFFTTKPPGEGTGLGMVTVQRLMEGLGGRIEVRSREGRGTTIKLEFPPAPITETAAQPIPP